MFPQRPSQARALLCLYLCFNLASGLRFAPVRRDAGSTTTISSTEAPSPTPSPSTTDGIGSESNSTTVGPSSSTSSVDSTSTTELVSSMTPTPTAFNSTISPLNTTMFNDPIPEGELPLTPRITPTYAVAGVFLIGTGAGYALVGIKTKWVHSFMAAAYLASLGTTILILYVMTPPISDSIQGAYLVAVVCTGVVLGGAALIFKDITECLACLLGGFCFSMWLLTLCEGSLVPQTVAKVVFITAFTLAALATYFSHYTRHYSLITSISFSGATAAVLGIDCFSRAGLKEFWAYIWDLNDRLFPLGADTYPLTKGIRVELAATILIFLAGMISQLRLWKVIQHKRNQREAQKAEGRRAVETEDMNVGEQVERANHRERRQWERVYGDGAEPGFTDSGVGDMSNDVKLRHSGTVVTASRVVSPAPHGDQFHMVEIPLDDEVPAPRRTIHFHDTRAGRGSVGANHDDATAANGSGGDVSSAEEKQIWVVGTDGEARLATDTDRTSRTFSPPPKVIPLPFTVPEFDEDGEQDGRSSVAAYVDDDGDLRSLPDSKRESLAKRLSVGSGQLLRSLSQRSKGNTIASHEAGGESSEELVVSRNSRRYDDNDSLAANLDDLSSEDADDLSDYQVWKRQSETEPALLTRADQQKKKSEERSTQAWLSPSRSKSADAGISIAETSSSRPLSVMEAEEAEEAGADGSIEVPVASRKEVASEDRSAEDGIGSTKGSETTSREAKSYASANSGPAVLKPEHLPRPLSRVALSYRTNEWAKHLSHAETPEPEPEYLRSSQYFDDTPEPRVEKPAPLDIEELQKTADNAPRPTAAPRSASAMSSYSVLPSQQISRTESRMSLHQAESRNISPTGQSFPPQAHKNPKRGTNNRRASTQLLAQPITEERDGEATVSHSPTIAEEGNTSRPHSTSSSPILGEPISRSASNLNLPSTRPPVPGLASYSSPQTLIGRREMLLRNRSQASFYASPTPEPGTMPTIYSRASSDVGSLYNYPAAFGIDGSPRHSLENNPDLDDLPLSHRRQILRQSSLDLPQQQQQQHDFDSHQPLRRTSGNGTYGYVPTEAARQAQLASFRSSVQADLRQGPPRGASPYGPGNRNSSSSATKLVYGGGWEADVRRSVDQQRSFLMSQKEAEAQRREMERLDRERRSLEFEERMRTGELLGAHREAMRRLQGGVRDS